MTVFVRLQWLNTEAAFSFLARGTFFERSRLASKIGNALIARSMVLDGEIVCIDDRGHCRINDLLFRRGEPCFVAFDLLDSGGKDVRREPLLDRKHELHRRNKKKHGRSQ